MDELIYGVWKGRAYDNRRTIDGKAPEGLPLSEFLAFNSGNPVAGFAGPQGFLMFDNRVTLADVLLSYYKRVRELACGRCTPCRAGGVMIVEALEASFAEGKATNDLARFMHKGQPLSTSEFTREIINRIKN